MANKIWSVLPPIVVLLATFHHLTFACICSPPHDIPISDPIWKDYVETVKVLKCSNCTDIPTNHDPSSITKLDLSSGDNKLTHLTPNIFVNKAFFNLREINLSNCGIMDVDKDAFLGIQPIKLLTLDLSYNSVSSIDTGSVSVRNLNLRGNPIKNLTFATYFMQQLDLSNCSLDETLPNAPFVDRLLNKINLESNKLTTLSWKEFRKTSLLNISLKGNPWRCDCHMQFLREYLLNVKDIDISKDEICDSPPELRGRGLPSIPRNQGLPCPLKYSGLSGTVSDGKIALKCLTEGMPEPVVKWYQEEFRTDNLIHRYVN